VGAEPGLDVDYVRGTLFQDDVFLLCSDGLNKVVDDGRIADILQRTPASAACGVLVEAAVSDGAPDDVSCPTAHVRAGSAA
jgi:serine/threonine protein phosphatase PrpC